MKLSTGVRGTSLKGLVQVVGVVASCMSDSASSGAGVVRSVEALRDRIDRGEGDRLPVVSRNILERAKEGAEASSQPVNVIKGAMESLAEASVLLSPSPVLEVMDANVWSAGCCVCTLSAAGATNVSGASDVRRPNRELRRLLPFALPCERGPVCAGFVGVGGRSSFDACVSSWPVGDCEQSSPSMLRKLLRLASFPPTREPKILTPLPKDSGEPLMV